CRCSWRRSRWPTLPGLVCRVCGSASVLSLSGCRIASLHAGAADAHRAAVAVGLVADGGAAVDHALQLGAEEVVRVLLFRRAGGVELRRQPGREAEVEGAQVVLQLGKPGGADD